MIHKSTLFALERIGPEDNYMRERKYSLFLFTSSALFALERIGPEEKNRER
jgi:hypothetical protein